jgi:hypothetical protein
MTDRPIIFSAPMVRTLLEGRKTMTRRLMKPQPTGLSKITMIPGQAKSWTLTPDGNRASVDFKAPPYAVGDRLYVREAHYLTDDGDEECVVYAEDQDAVNDHLANIQIKLACLNLSQEWAAPHLRLRPSIHMPRWASRLTLTVTGVKVERLKEISEADAVAEGIGRLVGSKGPNHFTREITGKWSGSFNAPTGQEVFADLWNSLHGPGAWETNPWVVAVSFEVRKGNIDG